MYLKSEGREAMLKEKGMALTREGRVEGERPWRWYGGRQQLRRG